MGDFKGAVITVDGLALQNKVQLGAQLNFTRLALGDGAFLGDMSTLSALVNEVKNLPIENISVDNGQVKIRSSYTNTGLIVGFNVKEVGVYATDPDVGEILYAVANTADGAADYIPAESIDIVEQIIEIITLIGNAENVTAVINTSIVYATVDDLNTLNSDIDANIVIITDELVELETATSENAKMILAGGTGETITLAKSSIKVYEEYQKFTFIASADNAGADTTIEVNSLGAKSLYKANTVLPPNIVQGKAYEVWHSVASSCFFLKASAEGNVISAEVLADKIFSNDDDTGMIGTMPNIGSVGVQNLTTEAAEYVIPEGYHNGLGKVKALIFGLVASVIKSGTTVGGIPGTYTSDATASAGEILLGETAYNNGSKVTGTMDNRGSVGTQNLTTESAEYTIPSGYHNGLGKVKAVISGLIASVIKSGTTVGGIAGTYTSDATASASEILSGETAYNNGSKVTGTMSNRGSVGTQNLTTESAEYTIPSGYHNGLGKVKAVISGLIASVIKSGTTVGGIPGTFTSDATVDASEMLSGETGYKNGSKVTGTMINRGSVGTQNLTTESAQYTIPAGYHNGLGKVKAVISGLIASVIKHGTTVGGIAGTYTSDATAVAGNMISGYTAYNKGVKYTGNIPVKSGAYPTDSLTRSGTQLRMSIDSAAYFTDAAYLYYTDPDFIAANILNQKNVLGIVGTAPKVTESTSAPSGGNNGDKWIQIE